MKKLHSLAVYALMAPAITLGIGSALAEAPSAATDRAQEQQERTMPQQAQKEKGMATADRAQEQRMAAERAKQHVKAHGTYLSSQPANSFRAHELIGSDLKSRTDNETIGEVSDLLIDENGQIVAAIVEVGGFLGLGKKDVAISWDSVEHSLNEKGDGYDFTVSSTKDSLKDAPEYKSEASKY
jgi:sporulation protein YlmC with PRC-barrel domain